MPDPGAPWHPEISSFALTFDGYASRRGRQSLGDSGNRVYAEWRADGRLPEEVRGSGPIEYLTALRELLLWEQRQQHNREQSQPVSEPPTEPLRYSRLLLSEMREARNAWWTS